MALVDAVLLIEGENVGITVVDKLGERGLMALALATAEMER